MSETITKDKQPACKLLLFNLPSCAFQKILFHNRAGSKVGVLGGVDPAHASCFSAFVKTVVTDVKTITLL